MNRRALSVPGPLRQIAWSKLSPWQRRKVATHVVVALLYPSRKASKKKRLKRRKAFRVLAARPYQEALAAALRPNATLPKKSDEQNAIKQIMNWVPTFVEAGSYEFQNRRVHDRWDEWWVHTYLFVLSMIRLRAVAATPGSRFAGQATQARAIFLITENNPGTKGYKAERARLERVIAKRRPIWPILCGLLYAYFSAKKQSSGQDSQKLESEALPEKPASSILSVHDLLPNAPPSSTDLIEYLMSAPEEVARAAKYFEHALTKAPAEGQGNPLLDKAAVLEIPFKVPTPSFEKAVALPPLSEVEIKQLEDYEFRHFRGGKKGRKKRRFQKNLPTNR